MRFWWSEPNVAILAKLACKWSWWVGWALAGLGWSQLGLTLSCIVCCLILQHTSLSLFSQWGQNSKRGSRSRQGLLMPKFGTGTVSLPQHLISQSERQAQSWSKGGEIHSTCWCNELQSCIAKGMDTRKSLIIPLKSINLPYQKSAYYETVVTNSV